MFERFRGSKHAKTSEEAEALKDSASLAEELHIQDLEKGLLEWHVEEQEKEHGLDALTRLSNRKVFERNLDTTLKLVRGELEEHRKGGEPVKVASLISIDIDHFKNINDTLGHPVGDEVLRQVAQTLISSVRATDTAARVGGEELMVLMPGADVHVAARHAEELRAAIEELVFEGYPGLKVTASFGVISSETSTDAKTLLENIDTALYAAKRQGRNRVEVYEGE